MSNQKKLTPMLAQYQALKEEHVHCLLFFRLGDFYELFFEDAVTASSILDITLTKRGKKEGEEIPMCGVPFHAAESYIARLIKAGQKVAICEQLETPEMAKKRGYKAVVKRGVVRIITPGTLTEENLISGKQNNFLATIVGVQGRYAGAAIDISTGEFLVERFQHPSDIQAFLEKMQPQEILVPEKLTHVHEVYQLFHPYKQKLTIQPDNRFAVSSAELRLKKLYNIQDINIYGNFTRPEIVAAGALVDYVALTQCGNIPFIKPIKRIELQSFLSIDASTQRSLELFTTLSGEKRNSFLHAIDRTKTSAGARLLQQILARPYRDIDVIEKRLSQVQWFLEKGVTPFREILSSLTDMVRITTRLQLNRGGPRDLLQLGDALQQAQALAALFPDDVDQTVPFQGQWGLLPALQQKLQSMLKETVPLLAREGDFIAAGVCQDLDHYRQMRDEGKHMIAALQQHYIQETGVSSLKIKFNNVLCYFIEVTAPHAPKLASDIFIHRQTLANNMRFTTEKLIELQQNLLSAADKALAREGALFGEMVQGVLAHQEKIHALSHLLAEIDVCVGFASLAEENNYVRPIMMDTSMLHIDQGRHPVVEYMLRHQEDALFTPNDCHMDHQQHLWLMTGPNMAGKSTFLRQNALIILMAHMGSFVPAAAAKIGCVDRIFSRVGAADDLARGQSTFMVEMLETAAILHQATERSFVILDEVGRGTSTYDGLSLAWSIVEYLVSTTKCRALFATHYHELTELAQRFQQVICYTIDVKEWENEIIFLHKVIPGSADKSYGIHVAQMAGLPKNVIARAAEILQKIQSSSDGLAQEIEALPLFKSGENDNVGENKLINTIQSLNPDQLSPREALDKLYELKVLLTN